jgi:hypothetical protein
VRRPHAPWKVSTSASTSYMTKAAELLPSMLGVEANLQYALVKRRSSIMKLEFTICHSLLRCVSCSLDE